MVGEIKIEGNVVIFRLHGVDRVFALKSELRIPLEHVNSVSTAPADWNYFSMLKVAGARIPGVVVEGRFVSKEGMLFYDMHDPNKCVTVELNNNRYKKVVFEVENKEATADMIKEALSRKKVHA